jgi:EpsI family protein
MKNGAKLALLIGFYDTHQGAVSVHMPKNCLPGDGWEIWNFASPTIIFNGQPVTINRYQVFKLNQRMTVLYWYQSRDRVIANEYLSKLLLLRDALVNRGRVSGSFVRIAMPDRPELASEEIRFAQGIMHDLHLCFLPGSPSY